MEEKYYFLSYSRKDVLNSNSFDSMVSKEHPFEFNKKMYNHGFRLLYWREITKEEYEMFR